MIPKINEEDFYKSINHAISENRHEDYLHEVIKNTKSIKRVWKNFAKRIPIIPFINSVLHIFCKSPSGGT